MSLRSRGGRWGAAIALACVLLPLGAAGAELKIWNGGATPPLALRDASGRTHDLAAYRGRVVLVNFWAVWCEPCREEMPAIYRLQQRMAGKPFAVLAVNLGESEEKVAAFLRSIQVELPVVFDKELNVARQWKARILPASFVLDASGRIRYTLLGDAPWDAPAYVEVIDKLLPTGRRDR